MESPGSFEFIRAHRDRYSVQMMCRVLEVAQSGYYAWLKQPISNHDQEDARLLRLARTSFVASHDIYGVPRVFKVLSVTYHSPITVRPITPSTEPSLRTDERAS
jgi:hypothetical protein